MHVNNFLRHYAASSMQRYVAQARNSRGKHDRMSEIRLGRGRARQAVCQAVSPYDRQRVPSGRQSVHLTCPTKSCSIRFMRLPCSLAPSSPCHPLTLSAANELATNRFWQFPFRSSQSQRETSHLANSPARNCNCCKRISSL